MLALGVGGFFTAHNTITLPSYMEVTTEQFQDQNTSTSSIQPSEPTPASTSSPGVTVTPGVTKDSEQTAVLEKEPAQEQAPVMEPETPVLTLPNVQIQSVALPTDAKKRGELEVWIIKTYYTTLTLVNNGSTDIRVDWQGYSSVRGVFDSGSVVVPRRGTVNVKRDYYYESAGVEEITYRVFYGEDELDEWVGTLRVAH